MSQFQLTSFMLAQDGAPPISSDGSPAATPTTAAPGGAAPAGAPAGPAPGLGNLLLPMIVVVVVVMLLSTFTQRRQGKKREAVLSALKKHDKVQTIGGVIGSVVEVKPSTVVLKVDEASNTRMTFARSAIQQILKEGPEEEGSLDERK